MKFGTDYKIAAYVGPNSATVALKKKNGILITVGDTALNGSNNTAFTYHLAGMLSSIAFKKQGKRWLVTITSYHDTERKFMQFLTKTQSQWTRFITTDYNGDKLKHQ